MTELHAFTVSPRAPRPVVMFDGPPAIEAAPEPAPPSRGGGFRGGVITLRYVLRTPRVRQFYRREFLPLSEMLAGLDRARHFREVEPERVDAAEQAVARQVQIARSLFAAAVARTEALLGAHPLGDIPIRYPDTPPIDAPIAHPQARGYMDALQDADAAFAAVERAWLFGLVDTRERRTLEASFRKAIRAAGSTIRGEYSEMARRLRTAAAAPANTATAMAMAASDNVAASTAATVPPTSRRIAPRAVPFPTTPGGWAPDGGSDSGDDRGGSESDHGGGQLARFSTHRAGATASAEDAAPVDGHLSECDAAPFGPAIDQAGPRTELALAPWWRSA